MTPLQIAVIAILDRAESFEWSIQGLGMLRLYIRDLGRVHIWNSQLRYANVSALHTHPWDLESTIVFGKITNIRYIQHPTTGELFWVKRLVCGCNTRDITKPEQVILLAREPEIYIAGQQYDQKSDEIHQSLPDDGTVTLMQRQEKEEGTASVYWPINQEFGNAKPRIATKEEIKIAVAGVKI